MKGFLKLVQIIIGKVVHNGIKLRTRMSWQKLSAMYHLKKWHISIKFAFDYGIFQLSSVRLKIDGHLYYICIYVR